MIYERIKAICDQREIPIYQLEAKAGVSNGTIGGWRTADPKMSTLKKVADALGVTIDELIKEEGA